MASRKLTVEFIGDTSSLDRAFRNVDKNSKGAGRSFAGVAKGAGVAGVALGGALAVGIGKAAGAFYESNKISKQTNAVLKSTGGVANVTAKQVGDLATALSKKTGIDDEAIQSGENLLLTFTKVRNETGRGNDIFNRATKTILDMSTALGQDTKTSAIQLGKALNDPLKGVTALQRVGVSFTEQQKEMIKTLVGSGNAISDLKTVGVALTAKQKGLINTYDDLADPMKAISDLHLKLTDAQKKQIVTMEDGSGALKAQKLILGELNNEFGGSAAATATNMDRLKVTLGNLEESVGSVFVPALEKVTGWLNRFVDGMMSGTGAGGRLVQVLREIGVWLSGAFTDAVKGASNWLHTHRDDLNAVAEAGRNVAAALKFAWEEVVFPIVQRVLPAIKQIVDGTFKAIGGAVDVLVGILTLDFGRAWDGVKAIFEGGVKAMLGVLRAATAPLREVGAQLGNAFMTGLRGALNAISGAAHAAVNAFTGAVRSMGDVVSSAGAWVTRTLSSGIQAVPGPIKDAVSWVKDRVVGGIKAEVDAFTRIGSWIVDQLKAGIEGSLAALKDAAKWIKDQLVKAVKDFLGISSPSKVMMELGGHMAMGIVKGFTSVDIKGLISGSFGGMKNLAGNLVGGKALGGVGLGGVFGKDQLAKWLTSALIFTNHFSASNLKALYGRAMQESGGNPRAINLWDINAQMGHPSKGLLQTIDSTFDAYKAAGHGDIWNPVDNAIAAINYMFARYGHIVGPSGSGYAAGTPSASAGWAWVGERGPELVRFRGGEQVLSHQDSMSRGAQVTIEYADMRSITNAQVFANRLAFQLG